MSTKGVSQCLIQVITLPLALEQSSQIMESQGWQPNLSNL